MKTATLGSVSYGTLRSEDLLSAFVSTLEGLQLANGQFLSRPENFGTRDRLASLVGDAQDCFAEDGETLTEGGEQDAAEIIDDMISTLNKFAPPFCYFGTHPGDGSDFGFWVSENWREEAEDNGCPVVSDGSELPEDFESGLWFQVSDHGNVTLFSRENGNDSEVWGIV